MRKSNVFVRRESEKMNVINKSYTVASNTKNHFIGRINERNKEVKRDFLAKKKNH